MRLTPARQRVVTSRTTREIRQLRCARTARPSTEASKDKSQNVFHDWRGRAVGFRLLAEPKEHLGARTTVRSTHYGVRLCADNVSRAAGAQNNADIHDGTQSLDAVAGNRCKNKQKKRLLRAHQTPLAPLFARTPIPLHANPCHVPRAGLASCCDEAVPAGTHEMSRKKSFEPEGSLCVATGSAAETGREGRRTAARNRIIA